METYIQFNNNGAIAYKPITEIHFIFAKDDEIPKNGLAFDSRIQADKMIKRNVNEIWYVETNKYNANEKLKTLVWQQAKIVEITTELGNTLEDDKVEGKIIKYFIREDPVKEAILDSSLNYLSASFIKEDKNAIHLPVDSEEYVPVRQNEKGEDILTMVV